MRKLFSTLTVKTLSDEERVIEGVATHSAPDRVGDVVVPSGAKFTLPLPLLSQHEHQLPIGEVTEAKTRRDRIEIVARIAKNSGLEYVENAWKQLKAGLVKGLSIGFRPLEYEMLDEDAWTYKFTSWEWFELSAVTIPAQGLATIDVVKAFALDPEKRRQAACFSPDCAGMDPRVKAALAVRERAQKVLSTGDYPVVR